MHETTISYNKKIKYYVSSGKKGMFTSKKQLFYSKNDNFYYVSMVVNDDWRVVRYDKANINLEKEATSTNNPSQTTQPTTIAVCTGLTYE